MNRWRARLAELQCAHVEAHDSVQNVQNVQNSPPARTFEHFEHFEQCPAVGDHALPTFAKVFEALERRCPDRIEADRWRLAIEDSRRFLAQWGEKAAALGWTARDLFGLHRVPDKPSPNYQRLSRYDETGLIWLLRGHPVVALTASTAAIESATGAVTVYRKNNKPKLGPLGDSLDDFVPECGMPR